MADIFISYKREDRTRVERISELLREGKMTVWFDAQLEAGRGEGFDAEIEREVTSAHCVIVCWTKDAVKSVYVRAEAKKGLERGVLVPILLEPCQLPVPFNDVDAIDLTDWLGGKNEAGWVRALKSVNHKVDISRADESRRQALSKAAYERIDDKLYPGTIALLASRITALGDWDARDYWEDINAILAWICSIVEKEKSYHVLGYDHAERYDGGQAWMFWDRGGAAERCTQIQEFRKVLANIDTILAQSEELLNRSAP
ncbi:MAG: toll/interleukin-1 receptor domain-containing protein [Candidatus Thiodiazotropha sp.]